MVNTSISDVETAVKKGCSHSHCSENALSLSDFCWEHTRDKNSYISELLKTLKETRSARGFNLKKIVLQDAELMSVDFSDCALAQSVIRNCNLFYNNFSGADMVGSDLSGSDLTGSLFSKTDLTRSNLIGARFWHSDLSGTILTEANLSGADLWQAKLYNARMWRTDIDTARFITRQNFSQKRGRFINIEKIDEATHMSAEDAYRDLKRYFIAYGRYNDASWASFKEKTMEKKRLRTGMNVAYFPVLLMGLLCGYGERPHRVVLSSGFFILMYGVLYNTLNALRSPLDAGYALGFWDSIYYSVVTFTTLGYGDIIPKMAVHFRMLAVSEAFIGAFMMGLFVFTLARKYSAR